MEKIIHFTLRNRLLMLVMGVLVLAAGYFSYQRLPVDAFPDVSPILVQVFTETEGLAPQEVEKYVTYPVEVVMNGLPNLKNIRSVSNFGLSVVNVYFEDGTDIYFARQLVNERLQEAREEIPDGFGTPSMGPISTGMGLILFYYLDDETGKYSLEELRTLQDWIVKFHLQTVPGVTEVLGIGGFEKQFHVVIKPDSLLRYGVSIGKVVEKLRDNNLNVGAQFIEKDAEEYIVRSVGLATDIEDIENITIKTVDGTPVYLGQLAEIKVGGAVRRGLETRNGVKEVVAGMVIKLFGSNSSTVIGQVEDKMREINNTLPEGVKIRPYYEQKTLVDACVKTVTDALVQGIILVIAVLIIFMAAVRPSLVVALSIPFSVLFAMIWMNYLGISANLMSFGGLAIAIGMMVDGSVVIVENVERWLRESDRSEPFIHVIGRASLEVVRPLIFSIAIIIIVFLPLFTLQGVAGKTFRPLAQTVALGMLGSLIFSVFLTPLLSSLLMKRPKKGEEGQEDKAHQEVWIVRQILKVYRPAVTFFVARSYMPIGLALGLIIIGLIIFPRMGSEFTPTLQEGTMVLRLTMAPSISLEESKRITMLVEKRLVRLPEISGAVSRIGRGEVGAHTDPVNSAEMYIILSPMDQWRTARTQQDLEAVVRAELGDVPGVLTNFTQPIAMTVDELLEGVRAELAIKIFGDDLAIPGLGDAAAGDQGRPQQDSALRYKCIRGSGGYKRGGGRRGRRPDLRRHPPL